MSEHKEDMLHCYMKNLKVRLETTSCEREVNVKGRGHDLSLKIGKDSSAEVSHHAYTDFVLANGGTQATH